jgi:SNF family Na+-dependent transporter
LGNFQTWLAAAGQIFFSISVGFGIIMNYASYMKRRDDVALSGLTAAATNELFEVGFGGMITLTASFIFLGLTGTIAAVQTGSFGLGFTTLPVVFAQMGSFGNIIGAIWFLMLFLAAITSSLSMYQPAVAFLMEAFDIERSKATRGVMAISLVGSAMTLWFTGNGVFWSTLDFWVGTFLIFVMAGSQIIAFSWVFGIDRGWREIHSGALIQLPRVLRFVMKYVAPLYLIIVFVGFSIQNLPASIRAIGESPAAQLAMGLIGVTLVGLFVAVRMGTKRWRAAGLDIDDRNPLDTDSVTTG